MPDIHWFGPGFEDSHHPGGSNPEHIVIYLHGWGVKWPNKGMFVDIARHISGRGVVSALFDLSDFAINGDATFIPLSDQQNRVMQVELRARELFPSAKVSIIAHSMGCRVTATLIPQMQKRIWKFILLAPAVGSASPHLKERMLNHHGSFEAPDGSVVYNRKDGTKSYVSHRYLEEFNKNWDEIYKNNLKFGDHQIIMADSDHREPSQEELMQSFGAITIPGSDHNFTGSSRAKLLDLITKSF